MNIRYALLTALLAVTPALVDAHGPSRQKVEKTVEISAPAAKVWGIIADFCAIKDWHPAVFSCEGEGGNAVGAKRVLTLGDANGGKIHEELLGYSAEKMMYKYKITEVDVKVLPVTTYSASITVVPGDGDTSKVTWKSGFYRGFTNNDPPPELNDEAAVKAITGVFDAGLAKIKELAEK
jgi:carbon monoxide dehydrogenase subunit G